jgi:hypothetical protein
MIFWGPPSFGASGRSGDLKIDEAQQTGRCTEVYKPFQVRNPSVFGALGMPAPAFTYPYSLGRHWIIEHVRMTKENCEYINQDSKARKAHGIVRGQLSGTCLHCFEPTAKCRLRDCTLRSSEDPTDCSFEDLEELLLHRSMAVHEYGICSGYALGLRQMLAMCEVEYIKKRISLTPH